MNCRTKLLKQIVPVAIACCIPLLFGCFPSATDADHDKHHENTPGISKTTTAFVQPVSSIDETIDDSVEFPVPKPPFSDKIFPCSRCHSALPDNFMRRELTKDHKQITLQHGPRERWCFDCHIQHHRDKLRLASGSTVHFSESYLLCGQCHGPKLRDWRVGVHGKRTGNWNGRKQYLLCAHCHDPHAPRFKPLKPKPPPMKPADIQLIELKGH